jgi:hypothetical protein
LILAGEGDEAGELAIAQRERVRPVVLVVGEGAEDGGAGFA